MWWLLIYFPDSRYLVSECRALKHPGIMPFTLNVFLLSNLVAA